MLDEIRLCVRVIKKRREYRVERTGRAFFYSCVSQVHKLTVRTSHYQPVFLIGYQTVFFKKPE